VLSTFGSSTYFYSSFSPDFGDSYSLIILREVRSIFESSTLFFFSGIVFLENFTSTKEGM